MAITIHDRSAAAYGHDVDVGADDIGDDGLRLAMRAAGVGAWRWDAATERIVLSSAAQTLVGAPGGPLDFAQFLALVHPNDRDSVAQAVRAAMQAGKTHDIDFHTLPAAGEGRWLRMRGSACAGRDGPPAMRGILIDIARRKTASEANSRLAAIVASSDDAIVAKTLDGIVTDWNRGAEAIFGYPANEIIGIVSRRRASVMLYER